MVSNMSSLLQSSLSQISKLKERLVQILMFGLIIPLFFCFFFMQSGGSWNGAQRIFIRSSNSAETGWEQETEWCSGENKIRRRGITPIVNTVLLILCMILGKAPQGTDWLKGVAHIWERRSNFARTRDHSCSQEGTWSLEARQSQSVPWFLCKPTFCRLWSQREKKGRLRRKNFETWRQNYWLLSRANQKQYLKPGTTRKCYNANLPSSSRSIK